jgi:hypothetical protein
VIPDEGTQDHNSPLEHFLPSLVDHHASLAEMKSGATVKRRGPYTKTEAWGLEQHSQTTRLRPLRDHVFEYCEKYAEETTDVLWSLLLNHLRANRCHAQAGELVLFRAGGYTTLSAEQCLALRVIGGKSHAHYRNDRAFFDEHLKYSPLVPLPQTTKIEAVYLPKSEPIDIMSAFEGASDASLLPSLAGFRFPIRDALVDHLEDVLSVCDLTGVPDGARLDVHFKKGGDGLGGLNKWKGLPQTKMLRYNQCLLMISYTPPTGPPKVLFTERCANSGHTNRPVLVASADEGNRLHVRVCFAPLLSEYEALDGTSLPITSQGRSLICMPSFVESMLDEKLERILRGLEGSGSGFVCSCCAATRVTMKSAVGTFTISRSRDEMERLLDQRLFNPDGLSFDDLKERTQGVKEEATIHATFVQMGMDATHADVDVSGIWWKKMIVREIAGLRVWEIRKGSSEEEKLAAAESRFDQHMDSNLGLQRQLMMPGNYGRAIIAPENEDCVLGLIPSAERREHLSHALAIYRQLRTVWRADSPDMAMVTVVPPLLHSPYKALAVSFGLFILEHFSYAGWPNYLHKMIEHVDEFIFKYRSLGRYSTEGQEAANKISRFVQHHHARPHHDGMMDALRFLWLLSSKRLRAHYDAIQHSKYACSKCGMEGVNVRTHPAHATQS